MAISRSGLQGRWLHRACAGFALGEEYSPNTCVLTCSWRWISLQNVRDMLIGLNMFEISRICLPTHCHRVRTLIGFEYCKTQPESFTAAWLGLEKRSLHQLSIQKERSLRRYQTLFCSNIFEDLMTKHDDFRRFRNGRFHHGSPHLPSPWLPQQNSSHCPWLADSRSRGQSLRDRFERTDVSRASDPTLLDTLHLPNHCASTEMVVHGGSC